MPSPPMTAILWVLDMMLRDAFMLTFEFQIGRAAILADESLCVDVGVVSSVRDSREIA